MAAPFGGGAGFSTEAESFSSFASRSAILSSRSFLVGFFDDFLAIGGPAAGSFIYFLVGGGARARLGAAAGGAGGEVGGVGGGLGPRPSAAAGAIGRRGPRCRRSGAGAPSRRRPCPPSAPGAPHAAAGEGRGASAPAARRRQLAGGAARRPMQSTGRGLDAAAALRGLYRRLAHQKVRPQRGRTGRAHGGLDRGRRMQRRRQVTRVNRHGGHEAWNAGA